jgi:hypothetical protein
MNDYGLSCEIAYRHEQLQRSATRRRPKSSTRQPRRWWFARRRNTTPEVTAAPAVLPLTMPVVGAAEFPDLATEVGH